jgi:hypothetical protein
VATRLRAPPYLETLVLMLAKAPPSLHERVVSSLSSARLFDSRGSEGA